MPAMRLFFAAIGLAAAPCALAATGHTLPWLYYEYNNRGPSNWGSVDSSYATCSSGTQQSPINIASVTVNTDLKPLDLHYNTAPASTYEVINMQKTIQLSFTTSPGYFIDPNENERYNLLQVHFHSPSEHGISGGRYPLEMHLVHTAANARNPHQLAVIGVFFTYGGSNEQLNAAWRILPAAPLQAFEYYLNASATYADNEVHATAPWEISVPGEAFYTYSGSLTTPPCTEGVKWFVMRDAATVSTAQVDALRSALLIEREKTYAESLGAVVAALSDYGDNRPFMPVNGRSVQLFPGTSSIAATTPAQRSDSDDGDRSERDDETWRIAVAAIVIAGVAFCLVLIALIGLGYIASSRSSEKTINSSPDRNPDVQV